MNSMLYKNDLIDKHHCDQSGYIDDQLKSSKNNIKLMAIETWGCQMNIADSELFITLLQKRYSLTEDVEKSDLIILNTCHIRQKADHKVISRMGQLALIKKHNPQLMIVLAGCVAQAQGKKLLRRFPQIDILLGPGQIKNIVKLIEDYQTKKTQICALGFASSQSKQNKKNLPNNSEKKHRDSVLQNQNSSSFANLSDYQLDSSQLVNPSVVHPGKNPVSRYVTIQQGCNNYCTFCVVPFTRGKEISVVPEQIENLVERLLDSGAKEICLLGQNVNSYGLDLGENVDEDHSSINDKANKDHVVLCDNTGYKGPFYYLLFRLLRKFNKTQWRLRFTTSNPHDLTHGVCSLFKDYSSLGKYFHLPVQSGSDRILSAMKRKVTVAQYLTKVGWLREACHDISLSTDIIVGFPGETEQDFEGTCQLVRQIRYSFIYAFCYSPRNHTQAARFSNQIDQQVKKRRLHRLLEIQKTITLEINHSMLGATLRVLFLYKSDKCGGYYGRSLGFHLVKVHPKKSINLVGGFFDVKITKASFSTLEGVIMD